MLLRLILFLLFFSSLSAHAQKLEHLIYQITPEEGLPDKQIYKILEDQKGFIWLATSSGLYRYDGDEFKLYRHPKQNKSAVFGIVLDNKKRLWFNTIDGQYFYVKNDKVVFFKEYIKESKQTLKNFSIIDDNIYISLHNIHKVNIETKKETVIKNSTYHSSVISYKDSLWVIDNRSKMNYLPNLEFLPRNKNYLINTIHLPFKDKILYVGRSRKGVNTYRLYTTNNVVNLQGFEALKDVSIHNIKTLENDLWFFTSRGIFKYSFINNKFVLKDILLQEKQTTDAIKDKQGYFLITTLSSGIYVVPNPAISIIKRENRDEYITEFEPINDNTVAYIEGKKYFSVFNTATSKVQYKKLKSFNQKLFFDTHSNELSVFAGLDLFVYPDYKNLDSFNSYKAFAPKYIIRISPKNLLTSYYDRITLMDAKSKSNIVSAGSRSRLLAFNKKNNFIYVDFSKGLKAGKKVDSLQTIKHNGNELFIRSVTVKPNSDTVYIVNSNNKILALNAMKVVDSIFLNHSEKVNSIASNNNRLWIGTNKGLFYYNFKTKKTYKLKKLLNLQVKQIELTDNFVWVISDNKIIRIDKNYENTKFKVSKPYFKTVRIGDEIIENSDEITLNNQQDNISLEFMINGYKILDSYDLEYQISNSKWQFIKGNRLTLSSLPYGKQVISVRATDKKTGLYTDASKITINVIRPFYKTKWFLLLLIITTVFLLYQATMLIIKNQNQKKLKAIEELKTKQQVTSLKLENLRSQMNPHFIFNALNSIQEYIYSSEKALASSYLVKFSRLIRIYLDHSRVSEITLSKEIEALELYLYLENSRFNDLLNYSISVDKNIDTSRIYVPSLFIQPYVENSIKHGLLHKEDDKKLEVIFNLLADEQKIIVTIRDNGIGRKASERINTKRYHKPFATKANLDRLELMNLKRTHKIEITTNDLYDEVHQAIGTEVIIVIPID